MTQQTLTQSRAQQLLDYCPDSGLFTRKVALSNSVKVGDVAGTVNGKGYVELYVDGRKYLAHRLAWLMFTGTNPSGQIDHVNGIKTDNRIANLRCVDGSTNMENQRAALRGSSSGLLGVSWAACAKKWKAQIQVNGSVKYLGLFKCKVKAHEAYLEAKRRHHLGCSI